MSRHLALNPDCVNDQWSKREIAWLRHLWLTICGNGRDGMKLRRIEWLLDFFLMFLLFVAMNALRKLHSVGQPPLGLVGEAIFAAAVFSLFNWVRKHGDD